MWIGFSNRRAIVTGGMPGKPIVETIACTIGVASGRVHSHHGCSLDPRWASALQC